MALQRATGFVRYWLPALGFGTFALVLIGRLVQLQVIDHAEYASAAKSELSAVATVPARRGTILDRNGNVLAMSVDTWDVYVNKRTWAGGPGTEPAQLAKLLGLPASELQGRLQTSKATNVLVATDVPKEVGALIETTDIPGVSLMRDTARVYPERDLAASLLGFTGRDNVGLAGLETSYNDILQGKAGRIVFERDTTGEPIPFGQYVAESPEAGKDLVLTIDRHLQQLAEQHLAEAMKVHRALGGSVIIMDPTNGDILAFAVAPSFAFSTLDLRDSKQADLLRNRSVTDLYEPGSVMKVITAAAALDKGVITPNTTYTDTGVVKVFGVPIKNWDDKVYGQQTMTGVLQNSINTGAVFMVQRLGQKDFHQYLDAFGFGRTTGIDLPGEAGGIIRRPADADYSPVDVATQSFGQSISVTPIQIVMAFSAAVNGGSLIKPRLVKSVIEPNGRREDVASQVLGHPISESTSAQLREMLRAVVDPIGSKHPGQPQTYTAGGKSGTANVPIPNGYDDRQVASFVGYAPYDDPKIVILVKLDQNADLQTGTQAAAPVFAKLADASLSYLGVRPNSPRFVASR